MMSTTSCWGIPRCQQAPTVRCPGDTSFPVSPGWGLRDLPFGGGVGSRGFQVQGIGFTKCPTPIFSWGPAPSLLCTLASSHLDRYGFSTPSPGLLRGAGRGMWQVGEGVWVV